MGRSLCGGGVCVGSNPFLPWVLVPGLRPQPTVLLTFYVHPPSPMALLGYPEHREMGETLPEEPGECSSPPGGLRCPAWGCQVDWSQQEAACVSSAGSAGEGGGGGRRTGAQIAWSVLRLTPGPQEDLTGDEGQKTICPR